MLLAATALTALVACGSGDGDGGEPAAAPAPTTTTIDPEVRPVTTLPPDSRPEPPAAGPADLANVDLSLETVADVADLPVMAMAVRPGDDDGVYLAVRSGVVVRLDVTDPSAEASEPLVDFSDDVAATGERGFLGLAFSPDGRRLYTSYTNRTGDNTLDEYRVSGTGADTTVDVASRREVMRLERDPASDHNGGNIAFGPDGYLYYAIGEGGGVYADVDNGQDLSTLLGKILRIDPTEGDTPYGVPEDNPYIDTPGARPEIWISGVRNPWRFSFDSLTGDLWIGDVGEQKVEEVDFLPADADGLDAGRGANLGWALMEGDQVFEDGEEPADHTPPIFAYTHADGGCTVIGGYVDRGTDLPGLQGAYLFVDRCLMQVHALVERNGEVVDEADLAEVPQGTVSFGEDAAGRLYLLQQSGEVLRLVSGPPPSAP